MHRHLLGSRLDVFKAPSLLQGDREFIKKDAPRFARLAEIMALVVDGGLSSELPEGNCPQLFLFTGETKRMP